MPRTWPVAKSNRRERDQRQAGVGRIPRLECLGYEDGVGVDVGGIAGVSVGTTVGGSVGNGVFVGGGGSGVGVDVAGKGGVAVGGSGVSVAGMIDGVAVGGAGVHVGGR